MREQRLCIRFGLKEFIISSSLVFLILPAPSLLAQDQLVNFSVADKPEIIGRLLAEHFVGSPHQYAHPTLHYSEVITWYGALRLAHRINDKELRTQLIARFEPLLPDGAEAELIPHKRHVDDSVFGAVPLEIAAQIHDPTYLVYGKEYADQQWESPLENGLSSETRFWSDDMYMITLLQVQAYRATGDRAYLDRAAHEMVIYLGKLQQPTGLFFHSLDVPVYWARGNGWVAAGMAELLSELPENHPNRPVILRSYQRMMRTLAAMQGKDGMWRQVLDRKDAWPETSGSAMFTFAMVRGVKAGWLDPQVYGRKARHAWIALVGYMDQNANMTNVCEGTNKWNDSDYYLTRRRLTGDFHGQGPMLWVAEALLQ